jgi:hypothetical protein
MTHPQGTGTGRFDVLPQGQYQAGLRTGPLRGGFADRAGEGPVLARADWLEAALAELPVVDRGADWQSVVHQRHARRHAEFALAAALRGGQMGRAIITMSESGGTSIHMFGIRAASRDGFSAAAAAWIETARAQARPASRDGGHPTVGAAPRKPGG